jgi:hypothetical protein
MMSAAARPSHDLPAETEYAARLGARASNILDATAPRIKCESAAAPLCAFSDKFLMLTLLEGGLSF